MSAFPFESASRIIDSHERGSSRLPFIAATCSVVAALTHAWVVRSHLTHWWGYGAFFAGLAVAQLAYAVLIARRPDRRLAIAGIGMNLGVLALYGWSRTMGVPMGPHAGQRESVGIPDLLAAASEIGLIVTLILSARIGTVMIERRRGRSSMAVVLVALVGAAVAGPVGHAHPRTPSITLAEGPETWVGPPPPSVPEPGPVVEQPATEPDPVPVPEEPAQCDLNVDEEATVPKPAGPGEARAVAYTSGGDVWLYDPATDKAQKVTDKGDTCWAGHPAFRNASYLSFVIDGTVHGLDLESGELDELLSTKHGIMATAWSPDGKTLAYLTYGSDGGSGGPQLVMFRVADGTKQVVRTFPPGEGRCGSEDDESNVAWAPDGHALIVVITHLAFGTDTMFVVDPSGSDLVAPRTGTYARWAPNSKRIYYRDFDGDRKWYALNAENGDRGTLGAMKAGTYDLAVSPDGSLLSYHDGSDDVGVFVYEVATKTQRRVAEDAVMAVWIGPTTLLVTDTKPCGDECFHSAWMAKETTSTVDVVTEERTPAAPDALWDADAWLEEIAGSAPAPTPQPTETPNPSPSPTQSSTTEPSPTPSTVPTPDPSPSPTGE